MPSNWNKGLNKENNSLVRKISETMRARKIDNFKKWREKMKSEGKIKSIYRSLKKDGDLAELIGVTLGDGHICIYPRTEELRITSNSNNIGFINRYRRLVEKVFDKKAYVVPSTRSKSTKVGIYEKHISSRLGIPSGARGKMKVSVPDWILSKKGYIIRYLRGLYEAEGSFCVHKQTYTYKFLFSNKNDSLLQIVFHLLKKLGFHPHLSKYQVQISKKDEVYKAVEMLEFRKY